MWLGNRMCSPLWHHCSNTSVHFYSSGDARDLDAIKTKIDKQSADDGNQSGNTTSLVRKHLPLTCFWKMIPLTTTNESTFTSAPRHGEPSPLHCLFFKLYTDKA